MMTIQFRSLPDGVPFHGSWTCSAPPVSRGQLEPKVDFEVYNKNKNKNFKNIKNVRNVQTVSSCPKTVVAKSIFTKEK